MRLLSFVFFPVLLVLTTALPYRKLSLRMPIYKRSSLVKDGVIDLDAARAHVAHSERKYLRGLAAYERYTGARAPSLSGYARRDAAPDPLTDDRNVRWYGMISVGSPPIEFKVDFDTGSADLLLPGANCGSTCNGHTLYNPNASSSAVDLNQNFTMGYGDGSKAIGEQYTDTVTVAGFVATNQTFGAASQYPASFGSAHFSPDGILGMSFPGISAINANPVIQTLIAENQLSDPVFTFKLAESGSQLTIGSIDTSLYTGPISYTPVTQQGFWKIKVDSINVNGQAVTKNFSAVIDTGTSFILSNAKTAGAFYSSLNATDIGNGYYTMPCNAMPNVSVTIAGTSFTISSKTFNLGRYNSSDNCVGAIAGTGNLGDTWIFGDSFLQNVYSIFDVGKLQVGFAELT